jgi:hypothetical protein
MLEVCSMHMTVHLMVTSVIAIPIFDPEPKKHEIHLIMFSTFVEASL